MEDYIQRMGEILGSDLSKGNISLSYDDNTLEQAQLSIKTIRLQQKQLRQVKKEINQDMKVIRAHYQNEAANVGAGLTGLLFGKKAAGKERSRQKAQLRQQKEGALAPYESLKQNIDGILLSLDGVKLQLESTIMELKQQN